MSAAKNPELEFANAEELEAIADLRSRLESELKALEAEGKAFPHVTGDIFFTRLLRGNSDRDEAVKWFKNFIEMRAKFGLDAIHRELEASSTPWASTAMPHSSEVVQYFNTVFDEEKLRTASGHVVWYDAMGDWRTKRMLDAIGKEKFVKFMQYACERRTSMLDRLSREKGRIVKILKIMDCEGVGLWQLNKEFRKVQEEHVDPVLFGSSIETLHVMFIINFPRVLTHIYKMLSRLLPPRVTKRIRLLGGDYMQNKEFLAEVGPTLIAELLAFNKTHSEAKSGDEASLEGSSQIIPAMQVMERVVEVSAGQTVSWGFRVAKPAEIQEKRSLLGKLATFATSMMEGTEVVFSVSAVWTDQDPADIERFPAKVRSAGVEAGDAAEFWVEGQPIDFAVSKGVNAVAVHPKTREVLWKNHYDVVAEQDAANAQLVADIKALPSGSLFMLAVKGTGAEKLSEDAWYHLKWVGATVTAGHWQSGYALIGCMGGSKGGVTVAEKMCPEAVVEGSVPTMETEAELVSPETIDANTPESKGSTGPLQRGGLIVVSWSNYHSFVTRKMVADFKVIVE